MSVEVTVAIMFLGIVICAPLCWLVGYRDGYKVGRSIGRDEGVVLGLRRANIEMCKGSDVE